MSNFKFRVVLDDDQDVFRDIVIQDNVSFLHLYNAIIDAFEFSGEELASFYQSNDAWDKGREIALMDMGSEPGTPEDMRTLEMASTRLSDLVTGSGDKFLLVYDFLKMWCFYVEAVGKDVKVDAELPAVVMSVGEAPDEHSRGDNIFDEEEEGAAPKRRGNTNDDEEGMFDEDELGDEFGFDEFEAGYDDNDF
jgi:hypothetical protein